MSAKRHILTHTTDCHMPRALPAFHTFQLSIKGQVRAFNHAALIVDPHAETERLTRKTK